MNHIAIKIVQDLERMNITASNNFDLLSKQQETIVSDSYIDNSYILHNKDALYDELYKNITC